MAGFPDEAASRLWLWLIPELAQVAEEMRAEVMDGARQAPTVLAERFLMLVWLVFVGLLTFSLLRQARQHSDVVGALVVILLVPVPVSLIVLLPIQWRKVRRGVRAQLTLRV